MAKTEEKPKNQAALIWAIADILRGGWKQYEYQDVILPLVVLKRLDSVLAITKQDVLKKQSTFQGKVKDPSKFLEEAAGYSFYNTSPYDFKKLLDDPDNTYSNFNLYLEGYSENVQDIIEKFKFHQQLKRLKDGNILHLVLKELDKVDLSLEAVSNHNMGYIFEELIRKFAEQSNETAGEHYTPREVIRLMVRLLLSPDEEIINDPYKVIEIYDPCCGTGGMLTVAKDFIHEHINSDTTVYLYGQELNSQTYAVCKADMLIKGEDTDRIRGGEDDHTAASTLSNDRFDEKRFDYIIANPPYGTDWKKDKEEVEKEFARGEKGRFPAGLPAVSDGQLLFLQHMVSKMKNPQDGGGRVAVVHNGSPLFTGAAGSGPSEIRRFLLENDLLEAIIALPTNMFYNTGISTYIWVLTNRKSEQRKGKVQLIDASEIFHKLRKNLGDKNKELTQEDIKEVFELYEKFEESKKSKFFEPSEFGFTTVTVERPLQLNFQISKDRIANLETLSPLNKNPEHLKKITDTLQAVSSDNVFNDIDDFSNYLKKEFVNANLDVKPSELKKICFALSEHDEDAPIILDSKGNHPEPDPNLRDIENIPLTEDIDEYFKREVLEHIPNAWMDRKKDKIGYEIPFNRYFYEYVPPRPLEKIDADLKKVTNEILSLLQEVES